MPAAPVAASGYRPSVSPSNVPLHVVTLTKRSEFVTLTQQGGSIVTKGLILQALKWDPIPEISKKPHPPQDTIRIGYTVSGKVGNAVVRNRVKRRLRAAVREVFLKKHCPALPGWDYVLVGRKAALDRPFEALVKDLLYALHQVKEGKAVVR